MDLDQLKSFDPYHKWLGIRDSGGAPNYYRLLGLELWEADSEIIFDAASRQINYLKQYRSGPRREESLRVIAELEQARNTLLDPELRASYDRRLRTQSDNKQQELNRSASKMLPAISIETGPIPSMASAADLTCPRCNTKNFSARHFCAGCGVALWEPCWDCGTLCGPDELHCGGCGVNLAAALQMKIDDLQDRLEQAQQMRQAHQHDLAMELLQHWPQIHHPKVAALRQQADRVVAQLQSDLAQAELRAKTALEDAQQLHDAGEFNRAAELLSQLPLRFLTEPMRELLQQTRDHQAEALVLTHEIRESLKRDELAGLLTKANRLLELKPRDSQLRALQQRLSARDQRRTEARRNQLCKLAVSEAKKHEYANAVGLLEQITTEARTPQIETMLRELSLRAAEVQWLQSDLRNAVVYDEHLLPIARRLLKLKPNDPVASKFVVALETLAANASEGATATKLISALHPPKSANRVVVERVNGFQRIDVGPNPPPQLMADPHRFCVAAGLALQALGLAPLQTNLAPPEKGVLKLFKPRKSSSNVAWGIDLGHGAIKAIQLALAGNRVVVGKSELIEFDFQAVQTTTASDAHWAQALDACLERIDIGNSLIAVGMPGLKVVTRIFTLPFIAKQKIPDIMQYEVKQQIPLPMEQLVWDYHVLEPALDPHAVREDAEYSIALLTSQLNDVARHLKPLSRRRIPVHIVQSENAALYNFLSYEYFGHGALCPTAPTGQSVTAFLDIGAESSSIVLADGQTFWFRTIPWAGNHFTRLLAGELKLVGQDAELLKKKPTAAVLLHRVFDALDPAMQKLADEAHTAIDQFIHAASSRTLTRFLVAGGGSKLHGMLKILNSSIAA